MIVTRLLPMFILFSRRDSTRTEDRGNRSPRQVWDSSG